MQPVRVKSGCWHFVLAGMAATLMAQAASAQSHGVSIGKSCMQNRCPGETVSCNVQIGHNDGFGDSVTILEAWDMIDPGGMNVRIPAVGNLPIAAVAGNTTCTVGGSLPCIICAAGSLLCPGSLDPGNQGVVIFLSNAYVIQPGDPNPLFNQATVRIRDNCNGCGSPPCPGCSMVPNLVSFGAATEYLVCEDENECTTDTCTNSACHFTPDCLTAADCDDNDACTTNVCTQDGCCDYIPLCTTAADCGDLNVCTSDICLPTGCCSNPPLCTSPADCNDGNVCTSDICLGSGCCSNPPLCTTNAQCNDNDPCTTDACLPSGCCQNTPFCLNNGDCADQDACTDDTCVDGCCESVCRQPTITCPANQTFECDNVGDFGDPVIGDDCTMNPTADCTEESVPGESPQEETITRTCTFTNSCGNSAECSYTIEIVDTEPPVVTCPPDVDCECDEKCDFGEPTVEDNCDPAPDIEIEVEQTVNDCSLPRGVTAGISPPPKLIITRTITATDGQAAGNRGGNTFTCEQTINVFDTNPPVLVDCPVDFTACEGSELNFTPPTCQDSCGTCDVDCIRSDGQPMNAPIGALPLTITCVSTDECNNQAPPCDVQVTEGPSCGENIPTVSEWGLAILALVLMIGGKVYFGRRPEIA